MLESPYKVLDLMTLTFFKCYPSTTTSSISNLVPLIKVDLPSEVAKVSYPSTTGVASD